MSQESKDVNENAGQPSAASACCAAVPILEEMAKKMDEDALKILERLQWDAALQMRRAANAIRQAIKVLKEQ